MPPKKKVPPKKKKPVAKKKAPVKKKVKKVVRSSVSGRFVNKSKAITDPNTTETERFS
jgi:hypothetical protein